LVIQPPLGLYLLDLLWGSRTRRAAMAESLLAVAVAAALPVVAHAQVTLSGRIDTAVTNTKNANSGISATGLASNTLTTNQLVLQGSEDLTGGLRANFIINSQFASDEKAALDWGHRGITVGLSGGFGTVDIGRSTCTTLCSITASGLIGNLGNMSSNFHTIRPDNSISYTTPSLSGLQLRALVALKEQVKDPITLAGGNKQVTELSLTYAAGPLSAQAAYVDEKGAARQYVEAGYNSGLPASGADTSQFPLQTTGTDPNGPAASARTVTGDGKHWGFRINYNAGFATLHARYQDVNLGSGHSLAFSATSPVAGSIMSNTNSVPAVDTKEYGLGAAIPLGGNRSVLVDYRAFQPDLANSDMDRFSIALVQNLSKRTNVYLALWSDKYDRNSQANTVAATAAGNGVVVGETVRNPEKRYDSTNFAVGVRHSF